MHVSIGGLTLWYDNTLVSVYQGCVYKEKTHFATLIPDFLFDEANRFDVTFNHLKRPVEASVFHREADTGITIFKLPTDKCKSLSPLYVETKNEVRWGDEVYLPKHTYVDGIIRMMPLKVCPLDGLLLVNDDIDERFFGSPILNSEGKLVGIISNSCNLPEKEILKLKYLWKPTSDAVQRTQWVKELSSRSLYFSQAMAFGKVPCRYE